MLFMQVVLFFLFILAVIKKNGTFYLEKMAIRIDGAEERYRCNIL